jgi:hypothetical protein
MRYIMLMWVFMSGYVSAHEWTPTYPKAETSHIPNILKVEMKLFNSREDVLYYEIGVFDKDWNPKPFALIGGETFVKVEYQQTKWFDVFIRNKDIDSVVYICSKSKLFEEEYTKPMFFSRICSKLK